MVTRALEETTTWPVPTVAAAVIRGDDVLDRIGPTDTEFPLASITKPIVAWAILVAVEEGIVDLDDPVGPDDDTGRTLRHLLAHAGGYGFDSSAPIVRPERKRIYSNTGFEVAANHVSTAAAMPFEEYLRLGVLDPLHMVTSELRGSPAHGLWSTVDDVIRFVGEVSNPTLLSVRMAGETRRPHFASLGGIVPGVGRFDNCPWGLGFEIRGSKAPHWTGSRNSAETYGHFGGSGTMTWIDPTLDDLAVIALTDRPYEQWASDALRLWPELSDAVIEEFAGTH